MMHSSGENGRKRKNDSDKRGAYRKFDEASSRMRDSLLHNCAERVVAHAASNNGSCRRGFVKDMVREIHERAPLMGISRDDINNKVRIMKSKREEEERREVSPAIPFHIIRDPSLSTNSNLSDSGGSSDQNPLDMLASQAAENDAEVGHDVGTTSSSSSTSASVTSWSGSNPA